MTYEASDELIELIWHDVTRLPATWRSSRSLGRWSLRYSTGPRAPSWSISNQSSGRALVSIVKAGRAGNAMQTEASHTGALAALLLIHAPTAIVGSGDTLPAQARYIFEEAGVANYETPAEAVCAAALADGREMLDELEAKAVLKAYGIPTTRTVAVGPNAKGAHAIGYAVALKVLSRDISHKSDMGSVRFDRRFDLRPIRLEDERQHQAFIEPLASQDIRLRFVSVGRELPRSKRARLTPIDDAREMAFVAVQSPPEDSAQTSQWCASSLTPTTSMRSSR